MELLKFPCKKETNGGPRFGMMRHTWPASTGSIMVHDNTKPVNHSRPITLTPASPLLVSYLHRSSYVQLSPLSFVWVWCWQSPMKRSISEGQEACEFFKLY